MYKLPKLPYSFNSLEPYLDTQTMEIHYSKHHQAYLDKLNIALEKYPDLSSQPPEDLLKNLNQIPEEIRTAVRNHGGGYVNHNFWWSILKITEKPPENEVIKAISTKFGSFTQFKTDFIQKATGLFGSGWVWVTKDLELVTTPNQDSLLTQNKTPILGVDLWEHAYYLKYQNRRPEFLEAVFHCFNWDQINQNFL